MFTISARPQLNGNSQADFAKSGEAILDAKEAVVNARNEFCGNVLHGRNYQHIQAAADATRHADVQDVIAAFNRAMRALDDVLDALIIATRKD